jgi:hypothetical protein
MSDETESWPTLEFKRVYILDDGDHWAERAAHYRKEAWDLGHRNPRRYAEMYLYEELKELMGNSMPQDVRGFWETMLERAALEIDLEEIASQICDDLVWLKSSLREDWVREEIESAFDDYLGNEHRLGAIDSQVYDERREMVSVDVFFEHGQWWARLSGMSQFDDEDGTEYDDPYTVSVHDDEGLLTYDGYGFEEV